MARLEQLIRGALVKGVQPGDPVTVVDVQWYGSDAIDLTFKDSAGRTGSRLLYRDDELNLETVSAGRIWSFQADGAMLRLVSEAYRIHLAYLFDPLLAVHTSLVEPLPHQITAVYEVMLPRQPLRFLLADDPGSGKTIMTGLLIKELLARSDLKRCLIVAPGILVEQWQDELWNRFQLPFEILTNDKMEAARTGNWFNENSLCIARLDMLSRNEEALAKLEASDWDLIVCDEAHKMSASYTGNEVKYTKRYHLGQALSSATRNFLLLTATPHNGKEADFQLFMALLDGDRFEGKYRDGIHLSDPSDMMRRLVKEKLIKFDGTPLFPERMAYTTNYDLSDEEARLYKNVTEYVREEFNRADALENDGRKGTVGFALTSLQRRLASSPESIYQSLRRRRERLEKRMREERLRKRGGSLQLEKLENLTKEDMDEMEDYPGDEQEEMEEQILDQATAAQTIAELEAEIKILNGLEQLAKQLRQSGKDRKWEEVSTLLQDNSEMIDANGNRKKLIIFTEYRDTLNYLAERIRNLLGRPEPVVTIHGGMGREERRKIQELFTQDKDTHLLIATDAAGEGINLQRAHLMINYDLPWNPNRLEQRFGRIHRIGQTEVCHCWNMVAAETREGEVYNLLLEKLSVERDALGGQVFDILGSVTFENRSLRELLIESIRYGDQPEVRARLTRVVEGALDRNRLLALLNERAIVADSMDASQVFAIREEMERAEARRLQPHYISSFFLDAFRNLGGNIHEREPGRYEITHVPVSIRNRDRIIGNREPILSKYERVTFDKNLIHLQDSPLAEFICPGHPLLYAAIDLIKEQHRNLLKEGAVLLDETNTSSEPRALIYLEHSILDSRADSDGSPHTVSRRFQFIEIDREGKVKNAGYAPYLDYRPLKPEESSLLAARMQEKWNMEDIERQALAYAVQFLAPQHIQEVRSRLEKKLTRTTTAVKDRLMKEINYWDLRAVELRTKEDAGKTPRINSANARKRADELTTRMQKRLEELEKERNLSPMPPVVIGVALIVPSSVLREAREVGAVEEVREAQAEWPAVGMDHRELVERLAMEAVMAMEREMGNSPRDVSAQNVGYDIESSVAPDKPLRFIEVKGRAYGSTTVTITRNEILTALNLPEQYILACVEVQNTVAGQPHYLHCPFRKEPDFSAISVNYDLKELLEGKYTDGF